MTELDLGSFVDHHCHGVVADDLPRDRFEPMMNESHGRAPLGTSLFDSMLGLSIRRWCAPVLGLEPSVPADTYLERRTSIGGPEASRRLLAAAGIDTFLVDTGLWSDDLRMPDEVGGLPPGSSREVVRLERLAEELLDAGIAPSAFAEEFEQRLATSEPVAAKSIAAYRMGLALSARKPSVDTLVAGLYRVRRGPGGGVRLAEPVVHAWLAWTAVEQRLPLQFHAGFGDSDLDLLQCDPLHLTAFLRATEERGVPILLLHNYPYHRQAAYLAQVFDHVFIDVGLATHNVGSFSRDVLKETLELAPFGKLLFSTDAYGLAELYLLGAILFRRGLGELLGQLIDSGDATAVDANRISDLICRENARRVYRLDQ